MSPKTLSAACLPLVLATLAASAAPAAATDRSPRPRWYAVEEVTTLVSERLPEGVVVRAIALDDNGRPALVIETLSTRGRVDEQAVIDGLFFEGRMLRLDQARALTHLGFDRRAVVFDAELERRTLSCTVRLDRRGQPRRTVARCGDDRWSDDDHDHHAPHPGHPQPPPIVERPHERPPQWSRLPAVIQACGDAFTGQGNELACLDRVDRFPSDPIFAIRACESATTGDANALACLGTVDRIVGDPSPLIQACEVATTGDANLLRCTAEAQHLDVTPNAINAVISACETATTGDENMLRCVGAVRGVRGGPRAVTDLIAACDQAMTGDEALLQCIDRRR